MVCVPHKLVKAVGICRLNAYTHRPEWCCDKCAKIYRSYKQLKVHKQEVHSY